MGHEVTLLQNDSVDQSKPPFNAYSDLDARLVWSSFGPDFKAPIDKFDFVFDNNSKSPTGPVESAMLNREYGDLELYAYVGSAGIYEKPDGLPHNAPLDESMPFNHAKPTAQFESALASKGIPHIAFRCQYIYGPLCAKHYLDYFTSRINGGLPIPIPEPGTQIVSLTDVRDVAKQLASVVKPGSPRSGIYNVGTTNDLKHRYTDVAEMIAGGLGKTADIRIVSSDIKTDFPFRAKEFFVNSNKSVQEMNFDGGSRELRSYIPDLIANFRDRGAPQPDTSIDEVVIKAKA